MPIRECPKCGGEETNREWLDWRVDGLTEVRTCDPCGIEYTNSYFQPVKEITYDPDE